MQNEKAQATDSATAEEIAATAFDPAADHHIERLQELAASEKTEQRHVLAAGNLGEGVIGQRVLIVQPDGGHSIVVEPLSE